VASMAAPVDRGRAERRAADRNGAGLAGHAIVESRSDGNQAIAFLHRIVCVGAAVHPEHQQAFWVVLVVSAQAEQRGRHGRGGLLRELDEQVGRAYAAFRRKDDDLVRPIYLRALQDTNEVLFYRLLLDHIEEMTPVVYSQIVALACWMLYRRRRSQASATNSKGNISSASQSH